MVTRKEKVFLFFCVALTLISAGAIVWFSGQNGAQSNSLSKSLAAWVLSLLPVDGSEENLKRLNTLLRKMAHFGLYFLLGLGLTGTIGRRKGVPAALAVVVLGGLFAASDEFHQSFSQDRTSCGRDVALDTCGVAAGLAVSELFRRRRERRVSSKD